MPSREFDLAVCAFFRDSQVWHGRIINHVPKFFAAIAGQDGFDPRRTVFHLLEGDSTDNTRLALENEIRAHPELTVRLHHLTVSGPGVMSVDNNAQRLANLSALGNAVLVPAREEAQDVLWMESDLRPPKTLLTHLKDATRLETWRETLAVAPVPLIETAPGCVLFYDTWAFERADGRRYKNADAYAFATNERYIRMRAVGSCALLNGDLLRKLNLDFGTGCFRHLCLEGVKAGCTILCDTSVRVWHPGEACIQDRWV